MEDIIGGTEATNRHTATPYILWGEAILKHIETQC